MRKKIKPLLVSILLLIACIPLTTFLSEEYEQNILPPTDEFTLAVNIENDGLDYRMNWWQSRTAVEDEYFVAIPGSLKNNRHKLAITGVDSVEINGKTYKNNSTLDNITEGLNSLSADGVDYKLYVYYTGDIPSVHIATESGNLEHIRKDKENKEAGHIQILNIDGTQYSGAMDYIKGRGNTSWVSDHPGYNIKLSENVNLFNMGAARKWSLLTPFRDNTLVKNGLAYKMSEILKMEYTPQQQHIDVFINNEYMGIYMLTESVEIAPNRIPIFNLEDYIKKCNEGVKEEDLTFEINKEWIDDEPGSYKWTNFPNNIPAVNGGYILEYEIASRYGREPSGFVSKNGQRIIVKHPEYVPRHQVVNIAEYYQNFENAIISENGYNEDGKHYSEYIDVDSLATSYIVLEWSKNLDAVNTSFYLYKDIDKIMKAGPVWDFDVAFGYNVSRDGVDMMDPVGEWVYNLKVNKREEKNMLGLMCDHKEFRELIKEKWENELMPKAAEILKYIDDTAEYVKKSMYVNRIKWDIHQDYDRAVSWYNRQIDDVKNFVTTRQEFLTEFFTEKTENK